jgi:hypothetical protein
MFKLYKKQIIIKYGDTLKKRLEEEKKDEKIENGDFLELNTPDFLENFLLL